MQHANAAVSGTGYWLLVRYGTRIHYESPCSPHQLFSLAILSMLWYGSLSHGMQRIGTLGAWTKAWSIVSFYESSTQLVSPGFWLPDIWTPTLGHQHLVTVSRLFKFKFLQGTPGYG